MTKTASPIWLDGELVPLANAATGVMSHAAQRGSLVFDVAAFHPTERGTAIFRGRDHVARFARSARIVGLALGFSAEELLEGACRVVAASGHDEGLVRWSVFFAAGEPDLLPRDGATRMAIAAMGLDSPLPTAGAKPPLAVAVFDDARKAGPDVLSAEAKAAAAYLGPMLARRRAVAAGADEVVLLDRDGDMAEAPTANAFAVVGGAVWTPPLGRVLPGITRDTVLGFCRAEGIAVREERLPRDAFERADEAFLSGTSLPIAPIAKINDRVLPAPGPITRRLMELVWAAQHGRLPEHAGWLTPASR